MTKDTKAQRLGDFLLEAWWLDLLLGVAVVVGGVILISPTEFDVLNSLDQDKRLAAYGSLISIVTFFAGFTSLSFAAYIGFKGEAMRQLHKVAGRRLKGMWVGLIGMSWLVAVAVWIASVLDASRVSAGPLPRWMAIAAVLVMFVQLARVLWLLMSLIGVQETVVAPTRPTTTTAITLASRRRSASVEAPNQADTA